MDWIQFPFEVNARVHLGPDAPVVRLRWVFTDAPFLPVGTGCVILNRVWNEDFWSELPVGQLPNGEADYHQDARLRLPPGFQSNHICHPEWLATGEPFPNDLPPQEYTEDGIPVCCGWEPATRGGVQLGGAAGDVYYMRYTDPTSGGAVVGGSAGDVYTAPFTDPASGGVEVGGEAGDVYSAPDPTEGGVEVGGEAGDVYSAPDPTEGGVEVGGEAGDGYLPPLHGEIVYPPGTFTFIAESSAPHWIECWAPGGNGSGQVADMAPGCSGGGGGAYSGNYKTLTRGVGYLVIVESGGSENPTEFEPFTPALHVLAAPGKNAVLNLPGAGGQAADCIGSVAFSGGAGGTYTDVPGGGGGGGGAAGSELDGTVGLDGSDPTGGFGGNGGTLSGGDGGPGGDTGFDGSNGGNAGGGAGGGGTGDTVGGVGGPGRMRIVW